MQIGIPREIKRHEYRVGLTPHWVRELVARGHRVLAERGCGERAGFPDADYGAAGAELVAGPEEVYGQADLLVKVKEPLPEEWPLLRPGQALFTYLHLAPNPELARALMAAGCVAIAYETVTDERGRLPLLTPMSQIAGRLATQVGAHYLENTEGGRGILLSGLEGAPPARVVILGGGNVGSNAAWVALGMGAAVAVFDANPARLPQLAWLAERGAVCHLAEPGRVAKEVRRADLVVGSVLIPGARAPRVVDRELVREMAPGTVLIDVAIDQGGCFETSRPTDLDHPVYVEEGVIHYCVPNMPSAVARTATLALTHITGPYVLRMAQAGILKALEQDPHLRAGLNVYRGRIVHPAVAAALGEPLGAFP
ncbi:MAG: alanine dehydrogenase [Porticoccaceae bacterium]|nr:MAG: alanine dehydrogenase [Porticoccaceae bacterium]